MNATTLKRAVPYLLAAVVMVCMAAEPAFAQAVPGGLQRVNTFMESILSLLRGMSVVVVAIALVWAGFKFLFQHADILECGKIVGASILIGGCTELARFLVG